MAANDREAHRRAFRTYIEFGCALSYVGLFRFHRARVGTERAAGVDLVTPNGEDGLPVYIRVCEPERVARRPSWWLLVAVVIGCLIVRLVAV
jgi:hypothetical protein